MRKRPFSLIEVIVSLGLLSLLLSTLFFWYRSLNMQKQEYNQLKWPLMEERYAEQRLQHILPKAKLPFFTTQSDKSLVFIFDRGPCLNTELSGKVLARLYYDAASQCICLGIWPAPRKEDVKQFPCETLVLLDGVAECHFKFYSPPDPFKKPVDPEQVGRSRPQDGWQDDWKASYEILPALVKLEIRRDPIKGIEDHDIDYVFDLPVPVIYSKERA